MHRLSGVLRFVRTAAQQLFHTRNRPSKCAQRRTERSCRSCWALPLRASSDLSAQQAQHPSPSQAASSLLCRGSAQQDPTYTNICSRRLATAGRTAIPSCCLQSGLSRTSTFDEGPRLAKRRWPLATRNSSRHANSSFR